MSGAARLQRSLPPSVVSAAIDDALESGNLRLIHDPGTRAMLTGYQDRIRSQREVIEDQQDWADGELRTFLIENARIDDTGNVNGRSYAQARETTFPDSRFNSDGERLIQSRAFENLIRDQIYWHLRIEARLASNADAFADAVQQLRSELAR